MMATGGVLFKRGLVAEAKPGFARVRFEDIDGLVSAWLPVVHPKAQNDRLVWTLDVGEQVACLMDAELADGCVVGAIYSGVDVPPVASADKMRAEYADGGSVEYDRATGAMTVVAKGPVHVTAPQVTWETPQATITGHLTVGNGVTVTGDVTADGISLKNHVTTKVVPGNGQSGPPA